MPGAVRQTTLLRLVRSLCKGTQNTAREARGILRGIVCGRESQKRNQHRENVGSELRSSHRCSCATFNHEARTRESQRGVGGCGVSITDCMICRAIPQPTERQHVTDQINAAMIFTGSDFVKVHHLFCLPM